MLRPLYDHATRPGWYRRAAADGVELVELAGGDLFAEHRPGTLMLLPWDGSQPQVLTGDVSTPRATTRATAPVWAVNLSRL